MDTETRRFLKDNPDLLEQEIQFWDNIKFGSNVEEHVETLRNLQIEIINRE